MTSSFLTVSDEKTVFANSNCTTNYNDILNKTFKSNAIKLFKWIKAKQTFLKGPDQKPIHCWIFLSLLLQLTIIITWLYPYIDCNIFITLYYTIVLYFIRLDYYFCVFTIVNIILFLFLISYIFISSFKCLSCCIKFLVWFHICVFHNNFS